MNLTKHDFNLNRSDRESIKNQKACTVWMSGLSASGKSTIANILEIKLHAMGKHTYIMDGDNTRLGLNSNLGFSDEDRDPKGLYKKARSGEIKGFTGVSSPFEIPNSSVRLINNNYDDLDKNVNIIIKELKKNNYL